MQETLIFMNEKILYLADDILAYTDKGLTCVHN